MADAPPPPQGPAGQAPAQPVPSAPTSGAPGGPIPAAALPPTAALPVGPIPAAVGPIPAAVAAAGLPPAAMLMAVPAPTPQEAGAAAAAAATAAFRQHMSAAASLPDASRGSGENTFVAGHVRTQRLRTAHVAARSVLFLARFPGSAPSDLGFRGPPRGALGFGGAPRRFWRGITCAPRARE